MSSSFELASLRTLQAPWSNFHFCIFWTPYMRNPQSSTCISSSPSTETSPLLGTSSLKAQSKMLKTPPSAGFKRNSPNIINVHYKMKYLAWIQGKLRRRSPKNAPYLPVELLLEELSLSEIAIKTNLINVGRLPGQSIQGARSIVLCFLNKNCFVHFDLTWSRRLKIALFVASSSGQNARWLFEHIALKYGVSESRDSSGCCPRCLNLSVVVGLR